MDTDVEVLKNLDRFLTHEGVSGFESIIYVPTGMMGCQKGFPLFKELLDEYDGLHFVKPDGSFDMTTNVIRITNTCLKYGLVPNGKFQIVNGFALYPSDYFCPKSWKDGKIYLTENSYTIHHFAASWVSDKDKRDNKVRQKIVSVFGENRFSNFVFNMYNYYAVICDSIKEKGCLYVIKKGIKTLSDKL